MKVPIVGERVTVRAFTNDDFHGIRDWVNDADVTSALVDAWIFDHVHSEAETRAFLESTFTPDENNLKLAIALNESGEYIGQINAFDFTADGDRCTLDIVLRKKHWGCGYAAEAIASVLNALAREDGIRLARIETTKQNARAAALARKCGFIACGEDAKTLRFAKSLG